jgi:shikimate kinase
VQHLLFLGGPPGVGKSTVAPLLAERLAPCAWVEADELWRMSPTVVSERTRRMVESNIVHVLREYLAAGYEHVFLSWVLHRHDLIERLMDAVPVSGSRHVVHLVATPDVLRARLASDPARGRSVARTLERLAQIEALPYPKLDTSASSPADVAERVFRQLRETACTPGEK